MSGKQNRKWEYSAFAFLLSFSSPYPTGKFLPASHTFPPSQDPQNPSHLVKGFVQGLPYRIDCPVVISQVFFLSLTLSGSCDMTSTIGWEDSRTIFKNKNYLETKIWWKELRDALLPRCWGSHYVVDPTSLFEHFIALNFVSPNKKL